MRRTALLLTSVLAASIAGATDKVEFQYTLELQRGGSVRDTSFLQGFETEDGLKLRVKLQQPSYCYVIASDAQGKFKVVFPERKEKLALATQDWARLPKMTFVRVGENPGVKRMYLVVAAEAIAEFDNALTTGGEVPESLALEVRDRYYGEGAYTRDLDKDVVSISYKSRSTRPAVVVEEISLRHR